MEHQSPTQTTNNKNMLIATLLIGLAMIAFLYFALSSLLDKRVTELENKINQSVLPVFLESSQIDVENHTYTIKEFNGKIGIYEDGDFQYQIDIYVFTLPEEDKKLLLQGIEVSSEQELNDIISCYY